MKAVQVSPQPGHAGQTLFATSFGVSLLIHGLMIGWMLSSGRSHSLTVDVPPFHTVSLVDAPGPALSPEPEPQPQAIAEPAAIPETMSAVTVQNVVPATVISPARSKQAVEVPKAFVESPAPVPKPQPVEKPEIPLVVETRVKKPAPARVSVKKPTPAKTSARKPIPAAPKVAAAQPTAALAPKAVAKPRPPANRNSPQAAARARETIAAIRRGQTHAQETNASQSQGGITAGMQEVLRRTYGERVKARVIEAWRLPMPGKTAQGIQARVLLTIDREGHMLRYELIGPSGSQAFDASLQRAVYASSPLPPLPETLSGETQKLVLLFTLPAS